MNSASTSPLARAVAEAGDGAQDDVFRVVGAAGPAAEFDSGEADQTVEIAIPELVRRDLIAGPEFLQPVSDGTVGRHRSKTSAVRT